MVTVDLLCEGLPVRSPSYGSLGWLSIALIHADGKKILLDPGGPNTHPLMLQRLKARGLAPADIDVVAISHCHWDHVLGIHFFPEAEIVVGRRELEWALKVKPMDNPSVPTYLMPQLASRSKLRTLDGDAELAPGLAMIDTPGHTPGHMSMVAETDQGTVVIAQDAVKNRAEFLERKGERVMDPALASASIERVASLAQVVIPGHDRAFRLEGGQPVYLGQAKVEIAATILHKVEERVVFSMSLG